MIKFSYLLIAILTVGTLHAQVSMNIAPEIGMFKRDRKTDFLPPNKISPVLGAEAQVIYKEKFFASIGVQYQTIESSSLYIKYHYFFGSNNTLNLQRSHSAEGYSFQKINIPILVGYKFINSKIAPSIFIGYKPNFLFRGNYYKKYSAYIEGQGFIQGINVNQNPLNKNEMTIEGAKASGFTSQITIGTAVTFLDRYELGLSYCYGNHIYASDIVNVPASRYPGDEFYPNGFFFKNSEVMLSLKYRFHIMSKQPKPVLKTTS